MKINKETEIQKNAINYDSIKEHKLFRYKSNKIYAGSEPHNYKTLMQEINENLN